MVEIVNFDLRGVPMPEQLQKATEAVECAVAGAEIHITTNHELIIKYLPSAAAKASLRIRMSMPEEDTWLVKLSAKKQSREV
jgi:hypothetical protein